MSIARKLNRFFKSEQMLPEAVELKLAEEGAYRQIKSYFGAKYLCGYYVFSRAYTLQGNTLETLIARAGIFEKLLRDVPNLQCNPVDVCKYTSHQQLMLWLGNKPKLSSCYSKDFLSLLIERGNVEELLSLNDHFRGIEISAGYAQKIIDFSNETLAGWLVEEGSCVHLDESHLAFMLEKGWHYLFYNAVKKDKSSQVMPQSLFVPLSKAVMTRI